MKFCMLFLQLLFGTICLGQKDSIPQTELTIVQGRDSIHISTEVHQIVLKAEPFKLVFHTLNTDAIFLNCSFDSTAYCQLISGNKDSLTCFHSSLTFSEQGKNFYRDIIVVNSVNRGYHCLFAYSPDDQIVRFDNVEITNSNNWIGVRTVEKIYVLPGVGITPLSSLKGRIIYLVFSPRMEKDGVPLSIKFE